MRGQMMSFKEKTENVKAFAKKINIYGKQQNLNFDMRGYADYLLKNQIPGNNVPEQVIKMFTK